MKRVAYLGIGFRDRDTAFDFKASLDDFIKRSSRYESYEECCELKSAEKCGYSHKTKLTSSFCFVHVLRNNVNVFY